MLETRILELLIAQQSLFYSVYSIWRMSIILRYIYDIKTMFQCVINEKD